MDAISKFCEDPRNPFQVKAELKVRKMLEKHTNWRFEFQRNEHKHGVDIVVYRYTVQGNDFKHKEIGKIEVEASSKWKNSKYPGDWKTYSYLRRKVEAWDKFQKPETESIWQGQPWDNANNVIYLKCAIDLSDCHAALVSDIWTHGRKFKKEDKQFARESRRWFYRIPFHKDKITKRGWRDSIFFAINLFSQQTAALPHN